MNISLKPLHPSLSLVCLTVASFLSAACYETVIMDPKADLPVVVNCVLVDTTSTQSLTLHYACSPSQTEPSPISDAIVSVSDGDGEHVFEYVSDGKWESKGFTVEYNREYALTVKVGDEVITARTTFPDRIIVRNTFYRIKDGEYTFSVDGETVTVEGIDECGGVMLQTAAGEPYKKACKLWVWSRSPRNADESVTYTPGHEYTCEFLATDNKYADNFNTGTLVFKDLNYYYLKLRDIRSRLHQIIDDNFDGEDARYLNSVVSNFNACTELLFMRKFMHCPLHRKVLRIDYPENYSNRVNADYEMRCVESAFLIVSDFNFDDQQSWAIRQPIRYSYTGWDNPFNLTRHEFLILSDEYDSFLKEAYTRKLNEEDGNIMDILYNRDNLPTNVSNGFGIFGAVSVAEYDPLAEFYYERQSHPQMFRED